MDKRDCIDCGRTLVDYVRGRPALRCGECKRGRRRIKDRDDVVCKDCGSTFKPPGQTGLPPERCGPCRTLRKRETDAEKSRRWREANPERAREQWNTHNRKRLANPDFRAKRNEGLLLSKYGLTMADFEALLSEQGGVCAICAGPRTGPGKRFHVDHCHATGKVRGLLCGNCNTAIGLLGDDPERADKAAAYLRR